MKEISNLQSRIPFEIFKERCREFNIETSNGWAATEQKIKSKFSSDLFKQQTTEDALKTITEDSIEFGDKAIKIFEIPEKNISSILSALGSTEIPKNSYVDNFPEILDELNLKNLTCDIFLCEKQILNDHVKLVFCEKRIVEHKEKKIRSAVNANPIKELEWDEYDEFILVKNKSIQSFGFIKLFEKTRVLQLVVDHIDGSDSLSSLQKLYTKLNEILISSKVNPITSECKNLFRAISGIYNSPNEGNVTELGFTTPSGSSKKEIMRDKKNDLRNEKFHNGGKTAVNNIITPFRISVCWPFNFKNGNTIYMQVSLPCNIRQLGSTIPFLDHMIIQNAPNGQEMQLIINKVLSYA